MFSNRSLSFIACTLIAMLSVPYGTTFGESNDSADFKAEMVKLDKIMAFAKEIEEITNSNSFDTALILRETDYEPDKIIQFVKESVSFELYEGVLRGAHGTLVGRAGNSLDQSILLAKLLRDAGFDARIARTKLGERRAKRVLSELDRIPAFLSILLKSTGWFIFAPMRKGQH